MQQERGRNNATALFGVHQIPSDQQIRNLLDPVPTEHLAPLLMDTVDGRYRLGALATHRALANGATQYHPMVVTPVLVAPDQDAVFPLPPAFVTPQDGHLKQDGELAASARWWAP